MISIITPTYNRANLIGQTIESVLNQSFDLWEMIIVDDGSDDNTEEIVNKYIKKDIRIKYFKRSTMPKGAAACRNWGVSLSSGKYLIFLDSDDILADFCLKQRYEQMMKKPNLDFAVFNMMYFTNTADDAQILFNLYYDDKNKYLQSFILDQPPWTVTCLIWKKDFFVSLQGFDTSFWIMDDPELHCRALLNKPDFEIFDKLPVDCFYRYGHQLKDYRKFIVDSIDGRIKFFTKIFDLAKNNFSKSFWNYAAKNIIKKWFIANSSLFDDKLLRFYDWLYENDIISLKDRIILKSIDYLWKNDNTIIRLLKLKGFLSRLL